VKIPSKLLNFLKTSPEGVEKEVIDRWNNLGGPIDLKYLNTVSPIDF
jgi:hypothetical protein